MQSFLVPNLGFDRMRVPRPVDPKRARPKRRRCRSAAPRRQRSAGRTRLRRSDEVGDVGCRVVDRAVDAVCCGIGRCPRCQLRRRRRRAPSGLRAPAKPRRSVVSRPPATLRRRPPARLRRLPSVRPANPQRPPRKPVSRYTDGLELELGSMTVPVRSRRRSMTSSSCSRPASE